MKELAHKHWCAIDAKITVDESVVTPMNIPAQSCILAFTDGKEQLELRFDSLSERSFPAPENYRTVIRYSFDPGRSAQFECTRADLMRLAKEFGSSRPACYT